MNHIPPFLLRSAVAELCHDVVERVREATVERSEHCLWRELSTCLLSSQVPYDLAVAASDAVAATGFWYRPPTIPADDAEELAAILSQPFSVQGLSRRYRFPRLRARQLMATRQAVLEAAAGLKPLLRSLEDGESARHWFIRHAPGIGPKQASMFLRNVGASDDLAILDRHVIRYMQEVGLWNGRSEVISGFKAYQAHEKVLRNHAQELGHPVGILDWAIWIVMRVASNRQLEFAL